jgi:hypothetical protein
MKLVHSQQTEVVMRVVCHIRQFGHNIRDVVWYQHDHMEENEDTLVDLGHSLDLDLDHNDYEQMDQVLVTQPLV